MNVQNLLNKIKIYSFLKNNRGSVTIEFVVIILVLAFMVVFMADLAILRSNMGKMDNLSYSLVNVLRERNQLYGIEKESMINIPNWINNETAKQQEIKRQKKKIISDFRKLAKGMFFGDPYSNKELYIVLEALQFEEVKSNEEPTIKNIPNNILGDTQQCKPTTNLEDVKYIAPRSEFNIQRTLPLYQVTICIPSYSIFNAITAGKASSGLTLRSSSIAVGR